MIKAAMMSGEQDKFQFQEDIVSELYGGWVKRLTQRKTGVSQGKWDVYLTAPDGTKLRSNPDLLRYLAQNPMDIDATVINFDKPMEPSSRKSGTRKLIKGLGLLNDSPDINEDLEALLHPRKRNKQRLAIPNIGLYKRAEFNEAQKNYLLRQLQKIGTPTGDQCTYMALQLKVKSRDVREWFTEHEALLESSTARKIKSFDISLEDIVDPFVIQDLALGGDYLIEHDNAELDADA